MTEVSPNTWVITVDINGSNSLKDRISDWVKNNKRQLYIYKQDI